MRLQHHPCLALRHPGCRVGLRRLLQLHGEEAADASAPPARAAVYQAMFADNGSAIQGGAAAFCVGIGVGWNLRDPAKSVLEALRDEARVKPASACDAGKNGERVVDRASGKPALLFGLDLIDCVSESGAAFAAAITKAT